MDKAIGGTTDTLLETLGLKADKTVEEYVRVVDLKEEIDVEEFRQKLKALKLKLKNHQDVFKAFILSQQKMYKTSDLKNLTAIKSTKDQIAEELHVMYQNHDTGEYVLSPYDRELLQAFYAKFV